MESLPPLCSAVILVKRRFEELPKIVLTWPESFSFGDEEQEFKATVNIFFGDNLSNIFLCNTTSFSCISLNFVYNTITYSLVVVTTYPFYHFFKHMFKIANEAFENDHSISTPINRFYFLVTAIAAIPIASSNTCLSSQDLAQSHISPTLYTKYIPVDPTITVTFPSKEFDYTFSYNTFMLKDFDPTIYFSPIECNDLWKALFTNEPVLLLTNDPLSGSSAALSAASLLSPLEFTDKMCLWLTETDPRFLSVINGESNLLLAATNSESLMVATDHFKHVFRLNPMRYPKNTPHLRQIYLKMRRSLILSNFVFERIIQEQDPYYDLIKGPVCTDQFAETLQTYPDIELPTMEDFSSFQTLNSFISWRSKRKSDKAFRDGLLNIDPEYVFKSKTKEQVQLIYSELENLFQEYANDLHVIAVLKKHRKIAKRLLSQ